MESHSQIISRLGGIRKVARMLGHTSHTTVQGWSSRNSIPIEHWSTLVQQANHDGKRLAVADLMPEDLRGAA